MEKPKNSRNQRLVAMTAELVANPNRFFSLSDFSKKYNVAKSTLSEDLSFIKEVLSASSASIESSIGAAGGVCYRPGISKQKAVQTLQELAAELNAPQRRLTGGFVYYSDLLFNPAVTARLGLIFARAFSATRPDQVLTLETKGIPLAMFTAYYLNCPLLIARRSNRVTEGPSVSTNYLTGSGRRIETMFLPKRGLAAGSNVLIIDDFMKAGGSALGMEHLVKEFDARVVGTGVLIATGLPVDKLVSKYSSLLTLNPDETISVTWEE